MKGKYDYDIIRDYLHGLVDQDTARRIRDLIRNDEVARNIAAGILQLEHDFKGNEQEIESYVEGLRQKQLKLINVQGKASSSRAWVRIAATLLIVAVASSVLWLTLFRGEDILEKELSNPYPLAVVERSAAEVNPGFDLYNRGEYMKAIASFNNSTNEVSVIFYNGLSNLYSGNYDKAIELLNSELLETSRYREQALWYRSLALIKAGRKDDAIKDLGTIGDNPHHYKSAEARKLLSSLVD